ncbi:MAG: hypothetical protein WC179_08795 [Candidatus Cloacimonadaceae bacterium]
MKNTVKDDSVVKEDVNVSQNASQCTIQEAYSEGIRLICTSLYFGFGKDVEKVKQIVKESLVDDLIVALDTNLTNLEEMYDRARSQVQEQQGDSQTV